MSGVAFARFIGSLPELPHIRPHEALGFHRPAEILRDPSLQRIHKQQTGDLVPEA